MKEIKQIIAENLISLRKKNNLTQNELAEKLNYSDNTISRWERGEITPTIETLEAISKLYNVPIEFLLKENVTKKTSEEEKIVKIKKLTTTLLCVSLVWFVSIITYFYCNVFFGLDLWILFIWSVPLSCLVVVNFARYMDRSRTFSFVFLSLFIWTFILGFYLQFLQYNLYLVFLIGVPAQIALGLWTYLRPSDKSKA